MARITCGSCGGVHTSAADVRACHAGRAADQLELLVTGVGDDGGPAGQPPPGGTDVRDAGRVGGPPEPGPGPSHAARLAGPDALGRWLLVTPDAPAPTAWDAAPRVRIGAHELAAPEPPAALVDAWTGRTRLVVEVEADTDLAAPAAWTDHRVPWQLPATFEPPGERLAHMLRTNAVDARDPTRARFPPLELALAAGASAAPTAPGGRGDVVLPDGTPAWVDGGPLRRFGPSTVGRTAVVPRVHVERGRLHPLDGATRPTADLAPDQLAAVAHDTAVARIIAPAGSGKTRVLTERARHLLTGWRLDPSTLCLVAYNRRAADEMRARTPDLPGLEIRTLNALGLAILRGTGPYRRRGGNVTVIDERQVRAHLDTLVDVPRRTNTDPFQPWLDALSAVRLGLRDPAAVEAAFGGDVDGLVDVLPRYRALLAQRGDVDFDEQIVGALEVLLRDPAARDAARRSCRILLVDEFQDLTPAHLLMIRLLAGPDLAVFGVGDDDQTIYGYTGATPEWLIDYPRIFPGAGDHPLTVNYRCPAPVVTAAGNLLGRNRRRIPKEIHPAPGVPADPAALSVERAARPLEATVGRVQSLLAAGCRPADVAVLTRVNASLGPVKVLLAEAGVPAAGGGGPEWLRRTGVRAALAWLRVAGAPGRLAAADLREVSRRPSRALSNKVVDWIAEQRTTAALRGLAGRLGRERDTERVLALADDIDTVAGADGHGTQAVLELVRSGIGLEDALETLDGQRRNPSGSHADDLDALVALAALHPDAGTFESWLAERLATPEARDGVLLASVHAVKGREWPHVVVHDANRGLMPHRLADDVEEERRVFHVAITRCSSSVTVVADQSSPTPFLAELAEPAPPPAPSAPAATAGGGAAPTGGGTSAGTSIAAEVGLRLTHGGFECVVVQVEDLGVVVTAGDARLRIPYGDTVRTGPLWGELVAPRPGRQPPQKSGRHAADRAGRGEGRTDLDSPIESALRAWRLERARRDGVPAYVVFHDATLLEIARRQPATLRELAGISGIGPTKLERYGDEVLGVVAEQGPPDV